LPIEFFVERTSEVIEASHCAMMVSGSVSLELMARRTPAAVIYRVGRFLHTVGKMMVKLDSITLPNLMNGRRVFPELVSVGSPEPGIDFLTGSVEAFLNDDFYYRRVVQTLDQLSARYAKPGASARAAQWVGRAIGANAPAVAQKAGHHSAAKAA
jgi:lipid-A-disaccharide synthase